jgi:hypothetical protein
MTMPKNADVPDGFAQVDVRVYWQGRAHRCVLRVSDEVEGAIVLALLNQAHNAVYENLSERVQEVFDQRLADKVRDAEAGSGVVRLADRLVSRGTTEWFSEEMPPDAPPLPKVDLCRSVVLRSWVDDKGAHARRETCGCQLNPDDSCPNADNHVGGEPHVGSMGPADLLGPEPCG